MNIDNISDTFDPVIAEQFHVLDQIEAPDLAQAKISGGRQARPYARYLMVASVAIIGLATVGALYVGASSSGGSDQDVASSSAEVETTDVASEASSQAASEAVVPPSPDSDLTIDKDSDELIPAPPLVPIPVPKPAPEPEPEPEPELIPVDPPTQSPPTPTGTPPPAKITPSGPRLIVSGIVTEVFNDCGSHLILNDAGKSEQVDGPAICDGGSHIVVGQTRIQTSSGLVSDGDPTYNEHLATLKPGTNVSVVTMPDSREMLTLDCNECGISVAIHG